MKKERFNQKNNNNNKKTLKNLIFAGILAITSILLLNWGLSEISSETPFGITPINYFKTGQIMSYWLILGMFCTAMFCPLYFTIRNLLHSYAKNKIFIHSVHSESMKNNRIIVTATTNKDNICRQYLLLSEVTSGSVMVLNLTTFKIFFAKIETTLNTNEIKKLKAPKKLTYVLNKKAWEN